MMRQGDLFTYKIEVENGLICFEKRMVRPCRFALLDLAGALPCPQITLEHRFLTVCALTKVHYTSHPSCQEDKSRAKGRSGCPVRPPESPGLSPTHPGSSVMSYTLEPISEEDPMPLTKKSRLTMDLGDILPDSNTLSYFFQYMESNSTEILITFWLDIENFKRIASNYFNDNKHGGRSKLTRTTSLESSVKLKHISNTTNNCVIGNSYQNVNNNGHSSSESPSGPHSLRDESHDEHTRVDRSQRLDTKPIVEYAVDLFKKYIALEAPHRLDLPDKIRNVIVSNICHPDGLIDIDCFKVAQETVCEQMSLHLDGFLKSPLYTKAQIDILTNGSLTLDDVLYNEMTLFYFTEYLEQERCSILLEFIMALTNFSDNLIGAYDPDHAQDDAIILYDKYFSLQATAPIGFPTEVRCLVEENICREGGPLPDCFHTPFRIVHRTLSRYVKTFLESELYFKYLSEMINSVDKAWLPHKKSLSDCSSEFSINTQNTLLAMGDPHFRSKRRNHSVPDMSIDSNQLYNADSLWHRKRQDGLSLGRINSLGRFESKLEPDPDKKQTSVLRKMVRKLVPSAGARVDEEMAWQVAHMIVKDVTDLTMAPPNSDT